MTDTNNTFKLEVGQPDFLPLSDGEWTALIQRVLVQIKLDVAAGIKGNDLFYNNRTKIGSWEMTTPLRYLDSKVDEVPDWLFSETLDEAAEAEIAYSKGDNPDFNRGLRDATLEALKRVSKSGGEPAFQMILRRAQELRKSRD